MRAALILVVVAAAARAAADPVAVYRASKEGFIDDPCALRSDGQAVAYLTTDGAKASTLHLTQIGGADETYANLPATVTALHWLDAAHVLAVWREGEGGPLKARAFGPGGASRDTLGPADQIALGTVDGKPAVVTYARSERKTVEHAVTAFAAATLRPLGRRVVLREDKEGLVAHAGGAFRPLWWERGLTTLVVRRAGEYDKTRDMQRPDRLARLDVFTGKLRDEQEIGDVLAFVHVNADHAAHPGEAQLAHLSDDHTKLLVVDGNEEHEVALPRALHDYEPETLRYQPLDDGRLALSLTVDPMNPAAQQRKKADPDLFELFVLDAKTRAATLELQLLAGGRGLGWRIGGHRAALLRKSKGFDRGGVALEIHDLKP
jgi:hypothetical protein